jgi:hypothetical protein
MMPMHEFLNNKKYDNAEDDKEADVNRIGRRLERFRDEMDKGVSEQGPDSQADEQENVFSDEFLLD